MGALHQEEVDGSELARGDPVGGAAHANLIELSIPYVIIMIIIVIISIIIITEIILIMISNSSGAIELGRCFRRASV